MLIHKTSAVLLASLFIACGEDPETGFDAQVDARNDAGQDVRPEDAESGAGPDARPRDAGVWPEDAGSQGPDSQVALDTGDGPSAMTATVRGTITRSAALGDGLDGIGPLFVALMDANPVTERSEADAVARVLMMRVDLSQEGSGVPFEITAVPVSQDTLYVSAFFDDNENADVSGDGSQAGPDRGDLVNLSLTNPLTVVVDHTGVHEVDVELNAALPF